MAPPLLGGEEVGQSSVSLLSPSPSIGCVSQNSTGLKERNYLGVSDCSSVDSSVASNEPEENNKNLNLKATELRLGLPGSHSPEREPEPFLSTPGESDEKPLFLLLPSNDGICSLSQKNIVSGNKRGFSEVKNSGHAENNWMISRTDSEFPHSVRQGTFPGKSGTNIVLSTHSSVTKQAVAKDVSRSLHEQSLAANGTSLNHTQTSDNNVGAPASKAQVIGWPPIRSFRKNTLASTSKNNEEVDGKPAPGALFVKVSMDGAPYLRKVDLRTCISYQDLSSALEKMFGFSTIGQCRPHGAPGKEKLSEQKLSDLHGSEYVLTYEDKDGDWMLVGDVPWEMFIETCKRLKIMKSSDAIGLAPRAMGIPKNSSKTLGG